MNTELKRALQQQASTFDQDIINKMIYLQGDEDLSSDYYQYSTIISHQYSKMEAPKKSENQNSDKSASNDKQSDFQQRKDRIMARIEAIKGKSFPGSYLRTLPTSQSS